MEEQGHRVQLQRQGALTHGERAHRAAGTCVLSEAVQPSVPFQPVRGQLLLGRREGAWLHCSSGPGLGGRVQPDAEVNLLSSPRRRRGRQRGATPASSLKAG